MARLNPYSLSMQITRMFEQGQSFFAESKVQEWLREHQQDPSEYSIQFVQEMAPVGATEVMRMRIQLTRRDSQPVDPWLEEEANRHTD